MDISWACTGQGRIHRGLAWVLKSPPFLRILGYKSRASLSAGADLQSNPPFSRLFAGTSPQSKGGSSSSKTSELARVIDSNKICTVSMNFELHYYHALVGVVNQSALRFQILDPPLQAIPSNPAIPEVQGAQVQGAQLQG